MVNRKNFESLYAQYLHSIAGKDNCRFHPREKSYNMASNPCGRMFQDRSKEYCQRRNRNYFGRNGVFESRDYRHACSMCPGDFSHTSCKYCLNDLDDVFPENSKDDYTGYRHDHRKHDFNNKCNRYFDAFYEEPPSAFVNYRNCKRNFSSSLDDGCEFCLKNGETAVIYSSHQFRNPSGTIACPLLKEYFCAQPYDLSDDDFRRNSFDKCNFCTSNDAFLDVPLYQSKQYDKLQRLKSSCRCCMRSNDGEMCSKSYNDYFEKCPLERASTVPLVKRLSNGFLTKQDYFDLLNLT